MKISSRMSVVKPSSTLAITAKAKRLKAEGKDVVGFGAGEPDFNTPEHINKAAIEAIETGFTKYTPATGIMELKEAISRKLEIENGVSYAPTQIVVSNGAKHSLTNALMAILNEGDEVIIPAPFWLSYPQMVHMAGGNPVEVKTLEKNDYKITVEDLEGVMTPNTKAIILNSPSNPTGTIYTKEELAAIADFVVEKDLFVISDEIYEKLIYDGNKHVSIAALNDKMPERTIIINGVSKSYAMTGWRIGYAAAPLEVAKVMGNMQSHATSNPNAIAQKAALAAIAGPQDCVANMLKHFEERRNYMLDRLSEFKGISYMKPQGAFYVIIDLKEFIGKKIDGVVIEDAKTFAAKLLEDELVAVIPCGDFGYPNHIRLSYAISKENIAKGLDRLKGFMNKIA